MKGIVQSRANRQLDEIPPVIHLYRGGGVVIGDRVFFENMGVNRHDDQKLASCGLLDSVDIASTTAVVDGELEDELNEAIPAAFLVDIEEASALGHKLCGHCLRFHPDANKEEVPEYQKDLDLDPAKWEEEKKEEAEA